MPSLELFVTEEVFSIPPIFSFTAHDYFSKSIRIG